MMREGRRRRSGFAAIRIGVGNAVDIAGEGLETCFVRMRFAGQGHGQQGASVERVFKANDRGALGVGAGDFDGVLDGFRAGVQDDGFLGNFAWSEGVQFFRESDVALVGSDREAEVQVFFELLAQGGYYTGRAMADIEAADSSREIDVAVAVDVFDHGSFSARGENWVGVVRGAGYGGFTTSHQRTGTRAGNFGAD